MPPTPPPANDDALDFDGLDMKPSGAKTKAAESDFEKELEALFAEELASSDEKPASAPPIGAPDLEPELEEDALLLDDLVADAPPAPAQGAEEDILDLSAFGAGGELELTPPEETPGGKGGDIDLSGLDDLISGLDGGQKPAATAPEEPSLAEHHDAPLDGTEMADLLESLDVPKAAASAAAEPEEELLELSLGDLVEEPPAAPVAEPAADASVLDLTLPDLSDPEPGRDMVAEQEHADDMGGELNLSLDDLASEAPGAASVDQVLDSGDLDMSGLMEGIASSDGEPEEHALNAQDLLAQIPDEPAPAPAAPVFEPAPAPAAPVFEPVFEPVAEAVAAPAPAPEPVLEVPAEPEIEAPAAPAAFSAVPLADAALAAGIAATAVAAVAAPAAPAPLGAAGVDLAELQARLAELASQVTGNSVAVMRLEGQLTERTRALAAMEERLQAAQGEAQALRDELTDLRAQLEESLRSQLADAKQEALQAVEDKAEALSRRVEGAEKLATGTGERLAQVEDRQTQLDSDVYAEISRAVPREAARIIREEIAHLAASMRDE